ncbi:Ig-like domain-containing protein [Alloalcanivorax sp. C16-2]|uniref:Ig-like domain-containing protein n=1 Tax=Alloalcanivorax sp. C16-2 TaxID=3390052 RepID=UPI0039709B35
MRPYLVTATLSVTLALTGCGGSGGGGGGGAVPRAPESSSDALFFSYPADGQTDIAPNAPVVFSFANPVAVTPANFQFLDDDGNAVDFQLRSVDNGRGVVLAPTSALAPITDYTVELRDIVIDDQDVVPPGGTLDFTTRAAVQGPVRQQQESAAFEIASVFPDDQQFQTMDFSAFRLRTSHPLDQSSAVYGDTIRLTRGGELVPAVLVAQGNAITVDPLQDMTPGDTYTLIVDGLKSRFDETIDRFEREVTPRDTTSPLGERSLLVTEVPAADPDKSCLDQDVLTSPLTGTPINCVPVKGTILADQTASKQTGNVFGELAFQPNFPLVTPLRVARGSRLIGDALEVIIGGEVPVGFNSGDVTVEMITDATGYLYPNPLSRRDDASRYLRLFMDLATTTADARANGAFTQNLMHLELIGRARVIDGRLTVDALTVVEPRVLGVETSYGLLSFRMASYLDQTSAPAPIEDTTGPQLQAVTQDGQLRLSWQPGLVADRMVPGEPVVLQFDETLDPLSIVPGDTLRLTKGGASEPFSWYLNGNALVITPEDPVNFGVQYAVTATSGITDLSGNPLQPINRIEGGDTLTFSLPEYVESAGGDSVLRGPFAMVVYPGFPCASSDDIDLNAFNGQGSQGVCLSSSSDSEQVVLDTLPIDALPRNRPIRVRFSQNMDPASLTLGQTCGDGSVRVERIDQNGTCLEPVPGVLQRETRALTFLPRDPWEVGGLYRYTLGSQESGCGAGAICSEAGLPLQTAPLLGGDRETGGPDMDIVFRGAPANLDVFQELNNLPSVDVNSNFAVDDGESPITDNSVPTPSNATRIRPDVDGPNGSGEGLVVAANTGCGFGGAPPYEDGEQTDCDAQRLLYIAGALNTDILGYDPDPDLPEEITRGQGGVAVRIYPTTVALTNLDATAVIGLDLDTTDGGTTLETVPLVGGLLNGLVTTLGDVLDILGLEEPVLGQVGNLGLVPIDTATGPNIMRVRYEPDENGNRTKAPVGYILPGDNPTAGDPPRFVIRFDLLFDAPALSLPLGLDHNVKSLPIDDITLEGTLDFLPDGRLFIALENQEPKQVSLEIKLSELEGGKVNLNIPVGGINLSYQSVSIQE